MIKHVWAGVLSWKPPLTNSPFRCSCPRRARWVKRWAVSGDLKRISGPRCEPAESAVINNAAASEEGTQSLHTAGTFWGLSKQGASLERVRHILFVFLKLFFDGYLNSYFMNCLISWIIVSPYGRNGLQMLLVVMFCGDRLQTNSINHFWRT